MYWTSAWRGSYRPGHAAVERRTGAEEAHIISTRPRRAFPGPPGRWVTSSVLRIGLLAASPGVHADTIPDWNLITTQTLQTARAGTGLAHSRVYAMCLARCRHSGIACPNGGEREESS